MDAADGRSALPFLEVGGVFLQLGLPLVLDALLLQRHILGNGLGSSLSRLNPGSTYPGGELGIGFKLGYRLLGGRGLAGEPRPGRFRRQNL